MQTLTVDNLDQCQPWPVQSLTGVNLDWCCFCPVQTLTGVNLDQCCFWPVETLIGVNLDWCQPWLVLLLASADFVQCQLWPVTTLTDIDFDCFWPRYVLSWISRLNLYSIRIEKFIWPRLLSSKGIIIWLIWNFWLTKCWLTPVGSVPVLWSQQYIIIVPNHANKFLCFKK